MRTHKYILVLLLVIFITPSLAFASWWNPGSWRFFDFLHKKEVQISQVQPVVVDKNYEDKINELQRQIEELKSSKIEPSVNTTTNDQIKSQIEKEVKLRLAQNTPTTANVKIVQNTQNIQNVEPSNGPTLSEQVGVTKDKFTACVNATDKTSLQTKVIASMESAMKGIPPEQRGTPYAVIIGSNGFKSEIRGAYPIDEVKKRIEEVKSGKVTTAEYKGEVAITEEGDHMMGSSNATVKVIEYSDLECPYCKMFHATMKQVVSESNGGVSWVYRHWPIHAGSMYKLVASECVAKIKGNDAFWKYVESIFEMIGNPSANTKL